MTHVFTKAIHRQKWVKTQVSPNAHAAGGSLCCDLRNDISRNPFIYQLVSNTVLNRFNMVTKAWNFVVSPALATTFGAGAGCVFAPSGNIKGTIAAGCTTTKITTSTVITAVGVNMLANRGGSGDYGFRIRVIGSAAGSSGKIEERWIVGNSGGTTPTILPDSALTFTPVAGDTYEILSGSVYMLGAAALAAASWRSFEVAANTLTSRTNTNLPATVSTDFSAVAWDEQYVPFGRKPGEGFVIGTGTYNGAALGCLTATAAAAGSITGQAAGGDATVFANQFRNRQIRIVEDTVNTTAVGQRRIIASHTAGASPVYTLGANWTVTPSNTAKYVIENPNLITLRSSGTAVVYTYNYSGASITNGTNTIANDAWHVTYFGNAPAVMAAGCTTFPSFGITPDAENYAKTSWWYNFRGGGVSTCDVLDISGGTTGSWETNIVYDGGQLLTTGTCGKYAPFADEGRFGYLNFYTASVLNQIFRFDVKNRVMAPYTPTDDVQAGTAAAGDRVACYAAFDGSTPYNIVHLLSHLSTTAQELIVEV